MPQVKKGTKEIKANKAKSMSRFTEGTPVAVNLKEVKLVNVPKKKK